MSHFFTEKQDQMVGRIRVCDLDFRVKIVYISPPNFGIRGVAQPGLAHLPWEQGVAGSNPVAPTRKKIKDQRPKIKD